MKGRAVVTLRRVRREASCSRVRRAESARPAFREPAIRSSMWGGTTVQNGAGAAVWVWEASIQAMWQWVTFLSLAATMIHSVV
ncbi:hypothetical protein GCM10010286_14720 [Streptomyces toxytricini]|nr:hypothetical protein GCM10010286_14720 [Streptomyces toxytricini]